MSQDTYIATLTTGVRTPELTTFFSSVTHLGDVAVVAPIVVFMFLALVLGRRRRYEKILFLTSLGSMTLTWALKFLIARPRPVDIPALIIEHYYSFPSAHAAASAALYGFCIYLVWQSGLSRPVRLLLTTFFALVVLAVGVSRIYLGVHYFSDVLVGWAIGAVCVLLCTRYAR